MADKRSKKEIVMGLTKQEQQVLAFSLFISCMRIGPAIFPVVTSLGGKLGIEEQMRFFASDWLSFSEAVQAAKEAGEGFPFAKTEGGDCAN